MFYGSKSFGHCSSLHFKVSGCRGIEYSLYTCHSPEATGENVGFGLIFHLPENTSIEADFTIAIPTAKFLFKTSHTFSRSTSHFWKSFFNCDSICERGKRYFVDGLMKVVVKGTFKIESTPNPSGLAIQNENHEDAAQIISTKVSNEIADELLNVINESTGAESHNVIKDESIADEPDLAAGGGGDAASEYFLKPDVVIVDGRKIEVCFALYIFHVFQTNLRFINSCFNKSSLSLAIFLIQKLVNLKSMVIPSKSSAMQLESVVDVPFPISNKKMLFNS